MDVLKDFKEKAASNLQTIIFAEGDDERIIRAAAEVEAEKIAKIIILAEAESIQKQAEEYGVDLSGIEIINPEKSEYIAEFTDEFYELRKHKGIAKEEAEKIVKDPLYFATMMIYTNKADGMVAGAANATGNVLRPAFQIVKTAEGISTVSSAIIMVLKDKSFGEDGVLVVSDCAVNPAPNSDQLAEIAITTADTTKRLLGFEPRVAMLSFSTMGSAKHENVDNVRNAVGIAHKNAPHLKIDGEMQADAALVESVGSRKAPGSEIAGKANVLIFPDLQSGNIGYKLVQRLAGADAVGPILQGLAAPINDLSRGCSVDDVVNLTAITAVQAQNE
ncbi:phosphate acetyltransferase [Halanaerobium congolense]|jgi:phosphate acetyltransferase|uniref:Phosphate acetyltransferase n=2 Tax=Halanaerobium congolense TaxID=54121 RepID=A0A1M7HFU9_9FIRM|nr:phosphate acetyltransferase [Halanaerobium congolense]PXV69925.1 phosphate acetyltransferase [Halanaerobium congolense]TDP26892.1 phosphate acetyltransferase [Halanaerobium congolense]TDS33039.1 phosphate acetyltransferase [Halanaerobium congolense]SDH32815.1 phosphate acetyltransferase [Halanaerobium congolense]SHM27366.1 phosphate acetyltransferase [Halanaerobium congolense]